MIYVIVSSAGTKKYLLFTAGIIMNDYFNHQLGQNLE